ncbi:hypothetical protein ACFL1K_04270 [Candidatus Omnitrophota bacterium]
MKLLNSNKTKAQSIVEYAILIGIISAALFAVQMYMKRGIQSVVKLTADEIGDQRKGSIVEGAYGEIRTAPPSLGGNQSSIEMDTESKRTVTQTALPGGMFYQEETKTEPSGGGSRRRQLHKEYIYEEE